MPSATIMSLIMCNDTTYMFFRFWDDAAAPQTVTGVSVLCWTVHVVVGQVVFFSSCLTSRSGRYQPPLFLAADELLWTRARIRAGVLLLDNQLVAFPHNAVRPFVHQLPLAALLRVRQDRRRRNIALIADDLRHLLARFTAVVGALGVDRGGSMRIQISSSSARRFLLR